MFGLYTAEKLEEVAEPGYYQLEDGLVTALVCQECKIFRENHPWWSMCEFKATPGSKSFGYCNGCRTPVRI